MLKKVFKRDFGAIKGVWWILALSVLGLTAVGSVIMRISINTLAEENADGVANVFAGLGITAGVLAFVAVIASVGITWILVHYNFYRSFYTDEGYLTFTLPVSRKTLLFSKTLNAVIWQLLHGLLLLLCAVIAFCIILIGNTGGGEGVTEGIWGELWGMVKGWIFVYGLELILNLVAYTLLSTVTIQLCVTVGAVIAQKHKLLVAIGIYYLGNTALSFVLQAVTLFGGADLMTWVVELFFTLGDGISNLTLATLGLWSFAAVSTLAIGIYLVVQYLVDRKLNLA